MAVTTANTILEYSTDGVSYSKLVDIIGYPDMGSTPSKLDTTDLSATVYKTSILGLQELPDLTFEANYDETKYALLVGLTASNYYFRLKFGTADGKFEWQGQIRCYVMGSGVDEVRRMTITLSAATPIVFATT